MDFKKSIKEIKIKNRLHGNQNGQSIIKFY